MTNPLRKWRDEKNLSQDELARMLGVNAMTVSRWERGSHLPRVQHWPAIKEKTGLTANDFVEFKHARGSAQ